MCFCACCRRAGKEITFYSIEGPFHSMQQIAPGRSELNTVRTQPMDWLICLRIYICEGERSFLLLLFSVLWIVVLQCNFISMGSQYGAHCSSVFCDSKWFDSAIRYGVSNAYFHCLILILPNSNEFELIRHL